jgi:hypothetical protein
MRALLCHCRAHLEASDDRALAEVVRKHLMLEHPALGPTHEEAWEIVRTRAYDVEVYDPDYAEATADDVMVLEPYQARAQGHTRVHGVRARVVRTEGIRVGARVSVGSLYRIAELRGAVGTVIGRYGGDSYVAMDVRFSDGSERLFRPRDLEEVSPAPAPWWRSLLGKAASQVASR